MTMQDEDSLFALTSPLLGVREAEHMRKLLHSMLPADENRPRDSTVSQAQMAAALNIVLFSRIMDRVPAARAYVDDVKNDGKQILFDHGALRTICLPEGDTGALPRGEIAFKRILEPLGYEFAALYPLPALHMAGHVYRHREHPETIPQFFVSELYVSDFDEAFGDAARRVFGTSRDPLGAEAKTMLDRLSRAGELEMDEALRLLPALAGAFERQHDLPLLEDYEILKCQSAEAAWIATEGNAFNHATDRVEDVEALAEAQKALGRPIKDKVERSTNGRVRQTAFRADMVERSFALPGGGERRMMVPGSFHEFISRDIDPETGKLDLSFDSGNATGIFHMTRSG